MRLSDIDPEVRGMGERVAAGVVEAAATQLARYPNAQTRVLRGLLAAAFAHGAQWALDSHATGIRAIEQAKGQR